MRVIREVGDAASAFASARAEALSTFGDGTLYLEKYIRNACHIEIQILADQHGNVCHLYDRDCGVQRRHQKLIEEAPSAVASAARTGMAEAALTLVRKVNYTNAGTVEFVYDADAGEFHFLQMNTRVQVEHPVTEMITGVDIVQTQIRIASGEPLPFAQADIAPTGHAIECRITADDAWNGFSPSPGRITRWAPPAQPGVRLDTHCFEGYTVPPFYDSMIAKVIAHGDTRRAAIERMKAYLGAFQIEGIATTIPFQLRVIGHRRFVDGDVTTTWVEKELLPELIQAHATSQEMS